MCQGQVIWTVERDARDIRSQESKVLHSLSNSYFSPHKIWHIILKLLHGILRRNVPAQDLNINILFLAMDPTRSGQPSQHGIFGCFDNCGICIVTYFLPCYTFGKKIINSYVCNPVNNDNVTIKKDSLTSEMPLIFTDFHQCTWLRQISCWTICEYQSHPQACSKILCFQNLCFQFIFLIDYDCKTQSEFSNVAKIT